MNILKKFATIFFILTIFVPYAFGETNEELREQAKVLYLGQNTKEARARILLIPQEQRTADDYYILGLTAEKPLQLTKSYENAIEKKQTFYQAYYNLGTHYFGLNDFEKAIYYFKQSVKYNKNFDYGYYNLGCAYLQTEQFSQARKSFENAIKIQPEEPDYYYNLGYTYKKLNNPKREEKAINLYNDLIKRRNEN